MAEAVFSCFFLCCRCCLYVPAISPGNRSISQQKACRILGWKGTAGGQAAYRC